MCKPAPPTLSHPCHPHIKEILACQQHQLFDQYISNFYSLRTVIFRVKKYQRKLFSRDVNSDSVNRGSSNQAEEVKQVDVRPRITQTVFQESGDLNKVFSSKRNKRGQTLPHDGEKQRSMFFTPYCRLGRVCGTSQGGGAVWGEGSRPPWPFRHTSRIEPRPTAYFWPEQMHKVTCVHLTRNAGLWKCFTLNKLITRMDLTTFILVLGHQGRCDTFGCVQTAGESESNQIPSQIQIFIVERPHCF